MRRLSVFLSFALCAATPVAAATSVFGTWATQKNNGRVRIETCGTALCGRIIDGNQIRANADQMDVLNPDPSKRARRVKGLMILSGYTGGPERWDGGNVYDPQTGDQSETSTLTLVSPDTLKVRGCNIIFCRSEIWTRAN